MQIFLARHRFRFVLSLLIALSLLFGLARFIDLATSLQKFDDYPLSNLGIVLLLSLGYFVLKALRWHFLLTQLNINLALRPSILLYLAGQWFAVAPAGEFVRAYLLTTYGFSFARGSAAVVAQVLFDFLSLSIVGSIAVLFYGQFGEPMLVFTAALIAATLVFAHAPLLTARVLKGSAASGEGEHHRLANFYHYSRFLLGWRPFFVGLALGLPATVAGFLVLFAIAIGYEVPIRLGQAAYIYSFSQLAGALSMLPHGLGAIEASAVALFHYAGIDTSNAATVVILFRLCTLGWGLLIGGISLLVLRTPLAGQPVQISGTVTD